MNVTRQILFIRDTEVRNIIYNSTNPMLRINYMYLNRDYNSGKEVDLDR